MYQTSTPQYEFLDEAGLKKLLKEVLKENKAENLEETLTEILDSLDIPQIAKGLEAAIYQYFRNKRILTKLPPILQGTLSQYRKIGFDDPGLAEKAGVGNERIRYVSQSLLNNLAGVSHGRVLGAYDRSNDTIYILNTLRGDAHDEVLFHERYHRKNPHASESETRRATARAGYNRFQGVYN